VLLVAGGIAAVFMFSPFSLGIGFSAPPGAAGGDAFYRELAEFDVLLQTDGLERPEPLNRVLDGLEKKSLGVEASLSLLKRRRSLARQDARLRLPYQKAVGRALKAFPFSEPIAAIAAEELLFRNGSISEETAAQLRDYASRITERSLKPLALSLYILAGDLEDPDKAAAIPQGDSLIFAVLPFLQGETGALDLAKDGALLQILHGDIPGATTQIHDLIQASKEQYDSVPAGLLQGAVQFFYDYGNPLQAAELLSQFRDEKNLLRQADALWLSGHIPAAQNIWTMLAAPEQAEKETAGASPEIKLASLYNLAATAPTPREAAYYLERMWGAESLTDTLASQGTIGVYGIMRYTRLLDTAPSLELLEREQARQEPLLALELLRRRLNTLPLDRAVAETWLLLNHYPTDERLYRWGAYFFDYQRRYAETALLIKNAGYYHISGSWVELHDSLHLIMEGRLDEAEERLSSIPQSERIWQIPANRGRILEARRDPTNALEYYKTAAAWVSEKQSTVKVLFRIGHCLRVLGRDQESRQTLERALELNPQDLNVRLELRRLNIPF
jgi:tetratricopeptide (TPR) repeat protein